MRSYEGMTKGWPSLRTYHLFHSHIDFLKTNAIFLFYLKIYLEKISITHPSTNLAQCCLDKNLCPPPLLPLLVLFIEFVVAMIIFLIAIYNSKAFKPARTTRPVYCVDSAHYTLYRESLIKGGDYIGVQVMSISREHNFNQEIFPFLPICVISPISQNTI